MKRFILFFLIMSIGFSIYHCAGVNHNVNGEVIFALEERVCKTYRSQEDKEKCLGIVMAYMLTGNLGMDSCKDYSDPSQRVRCETITLDLLNELLELID